MTYRSIHLVTIFLLLFLISCQSNHPFVRQDTKLAPIQKKPHSGNTVDHHDLDLHLDLTSGTVNIEDLIDVDVQSLDLTLIFGKNFKVEKVVSGKDEVPFSMDTSKKAWNTISIQLPPETVGKAAKFKVFYSGKFPEIDFNDSRHRGTEIGAYINKDSALLLSSAYWYPKVPNQNSLMTFDLRVYAPEGQKVLTSGDMTPPGGFLAKRDYTTFRMHHPIDDITLISGPYHVKEIKFGSVGIYTFFTDDDPELEKTYSSAMKEFLEKYQERFGPYPYSSLAIADSPLMEGLGFPQFMILGKRLLRIPGMVQGSLGHEILHNWWGNGVYPDIEHGNWSEGLVTYLHDNANSAKRAGPAAARRGLLEEYSIYSQAGSEPSLATFTERDNPLAMAVGYHKAAFIFGMIETKIGKDRFDQALKTISTNKMYQLATWEDFKSAFEGNSKGSLDDFFKQWVYGTGAPKLRIEETHLVPGSENREVSITLKSEPIFHYDLPIMLNTGVDKITVHAAITDSQHTFTFKAPAPIQSLSVDPEYTVLRKALPEELPVTIASVLETDAELPVIFSDGLKPEDRQLYEDFLKVSEIKFRVVDSLNETDGPTLLMGPPLDGQSIGKWTFQNAPWKWEGNSLTIGKATISSGKETGVIAWRGPKGARQPIVWIVGYSREGLGGLAMRLGYFISSSYVLLQDGKSPARGEWKSEEKPLQFTFSESSK